MSCDIFRVSGTDAGIFLLFTETIVTTINYRQSSYCETGIIAPKRAAVSKSRSYRFSKYWLKAKVFFHNLYFRWINGGIEGSHHFLLSMKERSPMYHKITLLAFIVFTAWSTYAQKNALNSLWRDSNIVINGDPTDWDQPFRYYDSKARIQYSVANDATNLYICLKTMDEKAQMKMLRTGMDVWIDTSGKKKETSMIRYPLANDPKLEWIQDPSEPDQQHLERPDLKKMKMDYSLSDKRMKLVGFKNIPNEQMLIENKYGIQLAIGWDKDDIFTYEMKVPFRTFYKEAINAADTLRPITIGVKVNGFDVPQQISNGSVADPSMSNSGMRNQGYGSPQSQNGMSQGSPQMSVTKINDMSVGLSVQMRMKLAYK